MQIPLIKRYLPVFEAAEGPFREILANGIPVFTEVCDELTLCPKDLAGLLENHEDVFGVIPVHMYGLPARTDEIEQVVRAASKKRGNQIRVICDAAHAFGSQRDGQKV